MNKAKRKDIVFYTKKDCPLCDEAKMILTLLCEETEESFQEVDIYTDDMLLEKYQLMIPVVTIDGKDVAWGQISLTDLKGVL